MNRIIIAMAKAIVELHKKESVPAHKWVNGNLQVVDVERCEHCANLCHSHEGLNCDDITDGLWPCPTMQIIEEWSKRKDTP